MSSCLGLPLAAAGGSEVLVPVPIRKAEVHCPLPVAPARGLFHPVPCLAQSQECQLAIRALQLCSSREFCAPGSVRRAFALGYLT